MKISLIVRGKETTGGYIIKIEGKTVEVTKYNRRITTGTLENGKIIWDKAPTLSGEKPTTPKGLEIGSFVTYEPVGSIYTWKGEYATIATMDAMGKTTDDVTLDSRIGGNDRITSWRVLTIDELTGNIELVPAKLPSTPVKLEGANGYNNAVKLLNDACSELYSDEINGEKVVARSIKIEDIEKEMDEEKLALAKGEGYPVQMKNAENTYKETGYTQNKSYPLIYEQENKSVINGVEKTDGLALSETPKEFIGREEKSTLINVTTTANAINGGMTATTSIKPYYTYYVLNDLSSALKDERRSEILLPNGSNTYYWVASRCVDAYTNYSDFYVHHIQGGNLTYFGLYYSFDASSANAYVLFPIVSLNSNLISGDAENGFSVK